MSLISECVLIWDLELRMCDPYKISRKIKTWVNCQVKKETDGEPSTKNHMLPKSEIISQTTPPNVFRYRDRLMFVYDVSRRAWFENVQRKVNQQNQTKQRLLQHRSCRKQIRLEGESCWCWRTHLKSPLNNINADNKNTIFNVCIADLTNYPLLSKLKKTNFKFLNIYLIKILSVLQTGSVSQRQWIVPEQIDIDNPNILMMTYNERSLDMDVIEAQPGQVVTGVQLIKLAGHLKLEIRVRK